MDLKKIAKNLTSDVPKVYLKRIDLSNSTSSSVENSTTSSFIESSIEKGNVI